jgi:MFS superfamily sulfate permease-like transporter
MTSHSVHIPALQLHTGPGHGDDFKVLPHSCRVNKADGVVGLITFLVTLIMTPQLYDSVLVGVILTAIVFMSGVMKPRSECVGMT